MTKTIARTSKHKIAKIRNLALICILDAPDGYGHHRDELFPLETAWQDYEQHERMKLSDHGDESYTIERSYASKVYLFPEGHAKHTAFLARQVRREQQAKMAELTRRAKVAERRESYVQPMQEQQPGMISAVRILITSSTANEFEAGVEGQPMVFEGTDCWRKLQEVSDQVRNRLIEGEEDYYEKVDYRVVFADGHEESDRWDICARDSDGPTLHAHLLSEWLIYAGRRSVAHWTPEQTQNFTKDSAYYLKLLYSYCIGPKPRLTFGQDGQWIEAPQAVTVRHST